VNDAGAGSSLQAFALPHERLDPFFLEDLLQLRPLLVLPNGTQVVAGSFLPPLHHIICAANCVQTRASWDQLLLLVIPSMLKELLVDGQVGENGVARLDLVALEEASIMGLDSDV